MTALSNELPSGYRSFTPSIDDAPRATAFFNLVEISEWGMPDFDESEIIEEWSDLDLAKSVVLVEHDTGELVASMTIHNSNGVGWEAFGYVHPEHEGNGLGTWITRWSEAMAAAREDETRPGYRITLTNWIGTVNGAARELMLGLGYQPTRVFRRMRIELEERPEPVVWPAGLELHPFVEGRDERAYFEAVEASFAGHWSTSPRSFEKWEKSMKTGTYDTELWLQLFDGHRIVGVCAGKIMGDWGWIANVGVLPDYRRRGLAKRLLQEAFGRYWDKGMPRIDLGVDSENRQSATSLYLGAGMRETHSYEANQKVLREGMDWRDDE
jgi:GNAT superfamily N-acetyltransferase